MSATLTNVMISAALAGAIPVHRPMDDQSGTRPLRNLRVVRKAEGWDPPTTGLNEDISTVLAGVFRDGAEDAIDAFNLPLDFEFVFPAAQAYAEKRGAEMIGMKLVDGVLVENPNAFWAIDETTRAGAKALLEEAHAKGWGPDEFASRLEESGLFGEPRAEMIARTEVALAESRGKTDSYKEAGIERVYVYDGDYDEECAEANGQIWDLEDAEANPLAHPQCERDFRPLTREEREENDQ